MSFLGTMDIRWVKTIDGKGFQYNFCDYVFKSYSGQDNVQVASAIEEIVKNTKEHYPHVKQIILQSDNATCFSSQELIPYIYHLNHKSSNIGNPVISEWIYTEAQTGRGRLDTHFSYINLILKSFVEDGNEILLEENILQAITFNGGISGTTVVVIDCSRLSSK